MSWLINIRYYSNATAAISLQCANHQEVVIFLTCVTVVSSVFGFPGAIAILLDIFEKRRKKIPFTPIDVFMLNLTVMDGIYLLFLQPELHTIQNRKHMQQAFISFLYSFHLCGRPLFITCMCLDCYLAVVHPVTYRARKSLTPRVLMAIGVWTVTVAYGCYLTICNGVLLDLSPVLFLVLSLPVIAFCDFSILWKLKSSSPGGKDIQPQKRRAMQIIINNIFITFICYLPLILTLLVAQYLDLEENTARCLVVLPVMHIAVVGNTVSLILYLSNLGKLDWLKCWKLK